MRWIDLLRMSSSNLRRRKLRTFLTVLGVVIGTASIVVMISLGLGMQRSVYQEIEQSGGATGITVRGKNSQDVYMMDSDSDQGEANKYITDNTIEELKKLEHVKSVSPTLELNVILLKGKYYGSVMLVGMDHEALAQQNMKLVKGSRLPEENASSLELVIGNGIPTMFYEKGTDKGYWETGELPDIDFMKDQMFLVLDQDAYYSSQQSGLQESTGTDGESSGTSSTKTIKKQVVHACAMVDGDVNSYSSNYYYVYCDLDTLTATLKREFAGKTIPGQPTTKSGKSYKFFAYTTAKVQADDIDNVDELRNTIQNMGYQVETNAEYMESIQKELLTIEAVLGGIGAVSLLVAAIGIANTMMMSIYERTKEIGVIKVLGCSLKNIKEMFLLEAAFIGLVGGVAGNISYIPPWLVLVSMAFAILVGMLAGYFPALRAMKLSPLAAIRNE